MKARALRPLRVGITQSNRSMPRRIASSKSMRPADAHQVARLVARQQRARRRRGVPYISVGRFADAEAADRVAGKIERDQLLGATRRAVPRSSPPCTMANCAWSARVAAARHRSAQRTLRRMASRRSPRASCRQGDDVVEHHGDVAAEVFLNGDGPLGRELDAARRRCASGRRRRCSSIFVLVGEAEDLEAAAVGEDRAVPAHEAVQAAERRDASARPAAARDDTCWRGSSARRFRAGWPASTPLTVACVPTGMNAGVSTAPCGVVNVPRRAAEPASECRASKRKTRPSVSRVAECQMSGAQQLDLDT